MRGGIWSVTLDGAAEEKAATQKVGLRFVTPGFFATLGIPVHAGRDVSESDRPRDKRSPSSASHSGNATAAARP